MAHKSTVLLVMDQLVPLIWEDKDLGLRKELISFQYKSIIKANELSTCLVTLKDVHLPLGRESFYLKNDHSSQIVIKLGHALTPIDWYIEKFLQVMFIGEESKCIIRTNGPDDISFSIHMQRIDFGGYYHEKSLKEMLDLAKVYKENGVKMFKQYPQYAHYYFTKAARCCIAYLPYGDLEERAKEENVNVNELQPLLENIYSNIAACLLKQNRADEIIDLLLFVSQSEQPHEKAVYRLALAYLNKKEFDKARDIIKRSPNYTENKDLMALFLKINQESKEGDKKYANMVKKMFQ